MTGDESEEKELEAKEMINMDGKENNSKLAKQHLVKRKKIRQMVVIKIKFVCVDFSLCVLFLSFLSFFLSCLLACWLAGLLAGWLAG